MEARTAKGARHLSFTSSGGPGLPTQAKEKDDPLLKAAGKLATTEVRKVMRRVHAPDSKDKKERKRMLAPFARLLAKAAHANPLPVCALIVSHVSAICQTYSCLPCIVISAICCPAHGAP